MDETGRGQILAVDDNSISLKLLVEILTGAGYNVRPATNGKLVLRTVAAEPPDLILLDVKMPEIDGFEVCRELKASELSKNIPVIFLTASSDISDKVKGFEAGAVDYIVKPYNGIEVLRRVETHLDFFRMYKELRQSNIELKEAKKQILQKEKMASIGLLAAGIAHEINNPLGFIMSDLDVLSNYILSVESFVLERISSADSKDEFEKKMNFVLRDAKEIIREVLVGAKRIEKIVSCLRSYSDEKIEVEIVNLKSCILDAITQLDLEKKKSVNVEVDIDESHQLISNKEQIKEVIINILDNAEKAIEVEGTIRVKSWREENDLKLSISDDGCGIAPEKINHIFEPFFTTREVGEGTGLGLSVAYEVVKRFGGNIDVESTLGCGTTFILSFPTN